MNWQGIETQQKKIGDVIRIEVESKKYDADKRYQRAIDLKIKDVENLEVDGADSNDYPDFCDAFFSYGERNGEPLTEDQLISLSESYPEKVNEMAFESFIP